MKFVVIFVITGLINVENRMLRCNYMKNVATEKYPEPTAPYPVMNYAKISETSSAEEGYEQGTSIKQKGKAGANAEENAEEEYSDDKEQGILLHKLKEPCAIMVQSSMQHPMQSLIRKYKYDSQGALIPSSVKYFIKVVQGYGPPVLVPLNGKSVSHLGGFVRYYKEVPPIPSSW